MNECSVGWTVDQHVSAYVGERISCVISRCDGGKTECGCMNVVVGYGFVRIAVLGIRRAEWVSLVDDMIVVVFESSIVVKDIKVR